MASKSTIPVHDIPASVTDEIIQNIKPYSAFLLKMTDERGTDAEMIGSGTLVKYKEHFAVLTAGHVVKNKKWNLAGSDKIQYLGIAAGDNETRLKFKRSHLLFSGEWNQTECPCGPDYALIHLPNGPELSSLKARASFWNIENESIRTTALKFDLSANPCWILVGFPGEWVHTETTTSSNCAIHGEGIIGPAGLAGVIERENHDLFIASIVKNELYEGPNRFSGMSGGGLWATELRSDESNRVSCDRPLLMGMPFFETASDSEKGLIFCHGRKTIYVSIRKLFETVDNSIS